MMGGKVASMLWAKVCRGPPACWADGPVGGLNGRGCVGVKEEGPFDGVALGPVGMGDGPLGVDGVGEGPDMCLGGA